MKSTAELTEREKLRLVKARLGGPSWWISREPSMWATYWYWDGKESWYTTKEHGFRLLPSDFTPESMLALADETGIIYKLVDDPREKK